MARTPTVYRWDDPGAPDLNAIMPTSADKNKLLIHTILKACLVDGYGTKSAAGWTMPLEEIVSDSCRFVLTNAANTGSLLYEGGSFSGGATNMSANTLWACSSVSNMDSPVNAWSFGCKYSNRGAATGTVFHKTGVYFAQNCDNWVVVANENSVVLAIGTSAVDFNLGSAAGPGVSTSGFVVFGAMADLLSPIQGDFYIAGGGSGSYTSVSQNRGFVSNLLTSNIDILGISKADSHNYKYVPYTVEKTYSPLSAWLPFPLVYNQYGPSAPDGNASSRLYFSAALPAVKKLLLCPYNFSTLNDFMMSNSFEYGKEFTYLSSQWVVFKAVDDIVNVVSLDPAEWGA
jgi:hypothetical protein